MSFKRFDPEDIVVSAESVTSPVWSESVVELATFFTSSTQKASNSGDYYYNVYNADPSTDDTAALQFAVAYGHQYGSGSLPYNSNVVGKTPTSTVYGQYRNLVLGDEDASFTFGTVTSHHFFVVSIDRARYKEKLLPGTLDLTLENTQGDILHLTDNSEYVDTVTYVDAGRVYELISGSVGTMSSAKVQDDGYTVASGSYGKFLPDVGVLILNAKALTADLADGGLEITVPETSTFDDVNTTFFDLIKTGASFKLNAEETIASNYIFVRARNSEFNYSTNPSLITGSGELRHDVMIDSPQSYVTTIGLYNDNNDLLGVAKLSRPLLKDFTKESLIRIKLDY
jgi:hypothetical protein